MPEGIAATAPVDLPRHRLELAWRLAPVGIAAATFALAATTLSHRSLSTDEAIAVSRARQPVGDLLHTIVQTEPAQAGFLLVLKLATAIFGSDEWSVRAPSALAVALAAGMATVLGTRLLGRTAGVVAGAALGANAGVIEVAQQARPVALGILAAVLATLLFVVALDRGGAWRWALYAVACIGVPLAHPLAASVLLAHGAALATRTGRYSIRSAAGVVAIGALPVVVLTWMALDRFDAPDGTGGFALQDAGRGMLQAVGANPVIVVAMAAGLGALYIGRGERASSVLVTGLVTGPLLLVLLAAPAIPVYADPALALSAPGVALAAAAATSLARTRTALRVATAALLASSLALIGVLFATPAREDWRALATAVARVKAPGESVVVLPERSLAAFAYYASSVQTLHRARGDGAWVAVNADDPAAAIRLARSAVRTPTYALRRQFRYGNGLRLQHWVRP